MGKCYKNIEIQTLGPAAPKQWAICRLSVGKPARLWYVGVRAMRSRRPSVVVRWQGSLVRRNVIKLCGARAGGVCVMLRNRNGNYISQHIGCWGDAGGKEMQKCTLIERKALHRSTHGNGLPAVCIAHGLETREMHTMYNTICRP